MEEHYVDIATLIADKIKVRYAEITEKTMGSKNMVIDAFYPTYVRKSLVNHITPFQTPILSKKCSAISPFIASELNVYNIKIDDLTKMLGYSKIHLKTMLETIKDKKLNLCLVGLGGTGMNFMHWAEEITNYTNSINIFEKIVIFDDDIIDITNIFRFPQILNPHSAYLSTETKKINAIPNTSILCNALIKNSYYLSDINTTEDYIFYGAPDIATRELFSNIPSAKFISGTHGDNDCQLYIKPMQDSELQVESYGMINLSVFFINQLKMTIEFLALLASDEDLSTSKLVMEYSFANEYLEKNILKAGLNRTYNFPIQKESTIDQETNIESPEPQLDDGPAEDTLPAETLDNVAIPMLVDDATLNSASLSLSEPTDDIIDTVRFSFTTLFEREEAAQPIMEITDHDFITAINTLHQVGAINTEQASATAYRVLNHNDSLPTQFSNTQQSEEQSPDTEENVEAPGVPRRTRRTRAQMDEIRRIEAMRREGLEIPVVVLTEEELARIPF
jgi:hypothetical protein